MLSWINVTSVLVAMFLVLARTASAQESKVLKVWDFLESDGWTYGNQITEPRIENSILEFTSAGSDPILLGRSISRCQPVMGRDWKSG